MPKTDEESHTVPRQQRFSESTTSIMPSLHRISPHLLLLVIFLVNVQTTSAQTGHIVFHVSEELPSGTLVGDVANASKVRAEVDANLANTLSFQILSSDGLRITSMFSINSRTGAVYTNAMIDREQVCDLAPVCQLEFDVTVKSGVNFVKLLTVRIVIDDINDNAPKFPSREISLTVPESSPLLSEIPISGALDHDAGLNTTITYSLQGSSVFGLQEVRQLDGTSALKLIVKKDLDREAVASYSFLILASDGTGPSSKTGTLTVGVIVSDVNDNVPKFSQETFNMTVMETAPVDTIFGRLTASDGDIGQNGELSFRFSLLTRATVLGLFKLNASSGEIVVAASLLYKSGKSYQCVVEVMDHGVPPQVSQASLQIYVADAGNTPPKLDLTLADPLFGDKSAVLYEDVQLGTFVGSLKVEDTDDGADGEVTCMSLEPHFSLQTLEDKRYGIVVMKKLDREERQELNVTVRCSDQGSLRLTSVVSFTVMVRDVNDNAPEFSQPIYTATVTENLPSVVSVLRVVATDRDDSTNSVVRYSLADVAAGVFSIDSTTGWISATAPLDREASPVISLTVVATDSGTPKLSGTALVSLSVGDVNDNIPYVTRLDYYVSENVPLGYIFDVLFGDDDIGVNGEVAMSVVNDSPTPSPLTVLNNGSIKLNAVLDREKKSQFLLTVVLKDKGSPPLSSTATLTIHVIDYNDHSPQFVFPVEGNDSVSVIAEIPVGTPLCHVSATDEDKGANGNILYTIVEGNAGLWFGINNQSGEIFVIRKLLGIAGTIVHLKIAASDFGNPRLTTRSVLEIIIGASNMSLNYSADTEDQDRYILIAGVIAGVTFVISVVVIAIIIHMRNSDIRRRSAERSKEVSVDPCALDNAKNSKVFCSGVVVTEDGKKNQGTLDGLVFDHSTSLDDGGFEPRDVSGTRAHQQGSSALTEQALEIHSNPSFTLFPEGRNRLVSEDHNSDTSGETTTCDSGRGASDEEIIYPLPGNGKGYPAIQETREPDTPPRIPPREPLSIAGKWSRDARVVSTNWTNLEMPRYFMDSDTSRYTTDEAFESDTNHSSSPASDFRNRARKEPRKVRFSFDGASDKSLAPDALRGATGDFTYPLPVQEKHSDNRLGYGQSKLFPSFQDDSEPSRMYQNRSYPSTNIPQSHSTNYNHRPPQDTRSKSPLDLPLHPAGLYQHQQRYSPSKNLQFPKQRSRSRNSDSLSSLPHSVDDDESTTTSGSYSIDVDDVMNASLEC